MVWINAGTARVVRAGALVPVLLIPVLLTACGPSSPGAAPSSAPTAAPQERSERIAKPFAAEPDHKRPGDRPAGPGSFRIHPTTILCGFGFMDQAVAAFVNRRWPEGAVKHFAGPIANYSTGLARAGYPGEIIENGQPVERFVFGSGRELAGGTVDSNGGAFGKRFASACRDDGRNILITQNATLNASSRPYKIVVTIRQGRLFWSESIARDGLNGYPWKERPGGYGTREEAFLFDARDLGDRSVEVLFPRGIVK
jgi:hypothetical protein